METKVRDELCRYVRDKEGNKVGCLYAVRMPTGQVNLGWSSYNTRCETKPFNKAIARDIAKGRAVAGQTKAQMPYDILKHVTWFIGSVNKNMDTPSRVFIVSNYYKEI